MTQGFNLWSQCHFLFSLRSLPFTTFSTKHYPISVTVSSALESTNQSTQDLSARERRRLRNERRESKSGSNWKEEVEERLLKKPKKRYASWTEELNLDLLAKSGPEWWVVRVSRVRGHETADLIARSLARNFPQIDFKVYAPAIQEKRKLKNGSYSVKPKPFFPGCVFLRCIMNREVHDFIREIGGVGGFIGSKVGNTKRQINKPRSVSVVDMESIFKQAKEEQERHEQEFEEEQRQEAVNTGMLNIDSGLDSKEVTKSATDSKPKRKSRKLYSGKREKLPAPGSTVRVVSGSFSEFEGSLKKVNRKTRKATVGFTLFGKESLVDLDINEIVAETE